LEELIKKEFISRILQEQREDLEIDQEIAFRKYLQFRTGNTFASQKFAVEMSPAYMSGKISYTAKAHVRFLDIKPFRRKSGFTDGKIRYIFNRRIEHVYLRTAARMMFGLTEEVVQGIKRGLNTN
jgi:hypothetical protein